MTDRLSVRAEILRKSIHLCMSVLAVLYYFFLNREQIAVICIILSSGFLTVDLLRRCNRSVRLLFMKVFSGLLRQEEISNKLTGATLLFIGLTLTVIMYDKTAAVPAMLFLTLADPVAALIGKPYGRTRLFKKSLEGSLAFFTSALLIISVIRGLQWPNLLIAGIAAVIEALPLPVNDNISIPVVSGFVIMMI